MFQVARVTDALSCLDVVPSCALLPEDFCGVSYSSRLLLPASLPYELVSDLSYQEWCESGFEAYIHAVPSDDYFSFASLKALIIEELFSGPSDDVPLVQHVGFLLGWLSALALTDRALALAGLDILTRLTDHFVFLSGRGGL